MRVFKWYKCLDCKFGSEDMELFLKDHANKGHNTEVVKERED